MKLKNVFSYIRKKKKQGSRAAEMLEFALILPFLLILIFGMFDISKVLIMYTEIAYVTTDELNKEVTGNATPTVQKAADAAKDRIQNESIFKGAIVKNENFKFVNKSPNQKLADIKKQNPNSPGFKLKGGNKMGVLICIDATVPVSMLTPIFNRVTNVNKFVCVVNEATALK